MYPGGQIGTDLAVLDGDGRSTVGDGSEAAEFVGSVDGTETTSARTAMGPTKAQTNARAPSRERRVVEGHTASARAARIIGSGTVNSLQPSPGSGSQPSGPTLLSLPQHHRFSD